jgi:hypothetical protein
MPPRIRSFRRDPTIENQLKYLWARTPAQTWFKPDQVTLSIRKIPLRRGDTTRHQPDLISAADLGPNRVALSADEDNPGKVAVLEFVQDPHWQESAPRTNPVRPDPSIFEGFLRLSEALDPQILQFASRFGALRAFCSIDLVKAPPSKFVILESCDVWRYFAASMGALLSIAGCWHNHRRPDPADWARLGTCPVSLVPAERASPDFLSPYTEGPEGAWVAMAHFVGQGERDRAMWTRLVNALLELGRVRPWLLWESPGDLARPTLVFSGPGLLSYLALQLCLRASKQDAFALCSYCHRQYPPGKRAPKTGQRNFCPECRDRSVPARMAQRSRRERLRDEKSSGA